MLRRSLGAAVLTLLLAGAAQAQLSNSGNTGNAAGFGISMGGDRRLSPDEQQREREIESRYRDAADKIPDKKGTKDPWGNVRSAPNR
jgi:hypothetical protein